MRLHSKVVVEANVTINDREAVMIEYITSFGFAKHFVDTCSQKYTVKEIDETLGQLREACKLIIDAKSRADDAINTFPREAFKNGS